MLCARIEASNSNKIQFICNRVSGETDMAGMLNWLQGKKRKNLKNKPTLRRNGRRARQLSAPLFVQGLEDRRMLAFTTGWEDNVLTIDITGGDDVQISTSGADLIISGYQGKETFTGKAGTTLGFDINGDGTLAQQTVRFNSALSGLTGGIDIDGIDNLRVNAALDTDTGQFDVSADGYFYSTGAINAGALTFTLGNYAYAYAPVTAGSIEIEAKNLNFGATALFTATDGDLSLTSTGGGIVSQAALAAQGTGSIILDSAQGISVRDLSTEGGDLTATGTSFSVSATTAVNIAGTINLDGVSGTVQISKGIIAGEFTAQDIGSFNLNNASVFSVAGDVTISTATGSITTSADIATTGGDVTLTTPDYRPVSVQGITTAGGAITVESGTFTSGANDALDAAGGVISITTKGDLVIQGAVTAGSFEADAGGAFRGLQSFAINADTLIDISVGGNGMFLYGDLVSGGGIVLTGS